MHAARAVCLRLQPASAAAPSGPFARRNLGSDTGFEIDGAIAAHKYGNMKSNSSTPTTYLAVLFYRAMSQNNAHYRT